MTAATPAAHLPGDDFDGPLYGASPAQAFVRFFRRYALFSGRASRSEFWWMYLTVVVAAFVLALIGVLLGALTTVRDPDGGTTLGPGVAFAPVTLLLLFAGILVPGIAVVVRRFHDANLSGLLALLWLIPYVGGLVVAILCILPSQPLGRRFDRAVVQARDAEVISRISAASAPPPPPSSGPEELSHAIASQTAAGRVVARTEVLRLAEGRGARLIASDARSDRFALGGGSVLVAYDGEGRVVQVDAAS